jgi:hypothetical protein
VRLGASSERLLLTSQGWPASQDRPAAVAARSGADSRSPILDFFIPSRGTARHPPPAIEADFSFFRKFAARADPLAVAANAPAAAGYGVESADRRRATACRPPPVYLFAPISRAREAGGPIESDPRVPTTSF